MPMLPLDMSTTSTANPFDRLRNHPTMASINAMLVPWLIAEYGMHYADTDNVETATHMLTHIIISKQLGGFTASNFPAAVDGHRVDQVNFTKFILKTGGEYCVASHVPTAPFQHVVPKLTVTGKANITHRKDIRRSLTKLLCCSREQTDRPEILVAESLGVMNLTDIILSRKRLSYLDRLCDAKGIVGEPVIFQTKEDRDKKKASVLGDGAHDTEKALYWILGGSSITSLASLAFIEIIIES
jgi:hypothetical protein